MKTPPGAKNITLRGTFSTTHFSIPRAHVCPALLCLRTPPGTKEGYSTRFLLPAVDRQPGPPRDGTRRGGSACAAVGSCVLLKALKLQKLAPRDFSLLFCLPKHCLADTMSMNDKIAQKLNLSCVSCFVSFLYVQRCLLSTLFKPVGLKNIETKILKKKKKT